MDFKSAINTSMTMPASNASDCTRPMAEHVQTAAQSSLMRSVADAMPAQIAYFDREHMRCRFANTRYARAYGHTPTSILGLTAQEILGPALWHTNAPHIQQCLQGMAAHYTLPHCDAQGKEHMLEVHLAPHTEERQVVGVFVLVYNITPHWLAQRSARENEERMRKFSAVSQEAIIFHQNGTIQDANPATERLTGYSIPTLCGRSIADLIHPDSRNAALTPSADGLDEDTCEITIVRQDGQTVEVEMSGKTLPYLGQEQRVVVLRDISARKQAQAQATFMSRHDPLTSLPNRQHLLQHIEHMFKNLHSASACQRVAVLFINLDHFKTVNDTLGHYVGDELLRAVARRIKASVRPQDFVARLGSDEFVVLIPELNDANNAPMLAHELLQLISAPLELAGMPISLSPSIGVSLYPEHGTYGEELLRRANQAMVYAKESGRANSQLYTESLDGRVPYQDLALERELREAIAQQQLVLHYQPQIRLTDGQLAGFEALVRWQHPQRGLVGPNDFIPFAEKRGLISAIGRWVLHEACRQLKAWLDAGQLPPVPVAVNISALELRQRDVLTDIQQALASTGLQPQFLEVEITESVLMQQLSPTQNILTALQSLGVGVAIDDFGTGYSSLAYLKRYPVDKLKIDRSFLNDIPGSRDDVAIVTAIIQMARSLQLQVVAEGVEYPQQRALLHDLGCALAQGYGLSHPLAAQHVPEWWTHWQAQEEAAYAHTP